MTAHLQGRDRSENGARASSVLTAGGVATCLGSLGITLTSVLYALSPPAAATPMQPFDPAAAVAGAIAGAASMHAASLVGMFSDLFLATGALLIALEAGRRNRGLAAAGWIAIFLSVLIFVLVDTLVGLLPLAATQGAVGAFVGFKLLFDALFLLGTVAFGIGALASMAGEYVRPARWVSRPLALISAMTGVASVVAAAACFFHLPMQLAVGGSILLGGALFTVIGAQIAAGGDLGA